MFESKISLGSCLVPPKSMFENKILLGNSVLKKQDLRYFCKLKFDPNLNLQTLIQTCTKRAK